MKTIACSLALLVGLFSGVAAHAQTAPAEGKHGKAAHLKALDTNGDKRLSREEAQGHEKLSKHFDEMDTDKDGYLSAKEVHAFSKNHKGTSFDKLDTNDDGKLSRDEAAKNPKAARRFDAADANKDGQVTKQEMKDARKHKTTP